MKNKQTNLPNNLLLFIKKIIRKRKSLQYGIHEEKSGINGSSKNIDWIFYLKDQVPKFIRQLKGKRRIGFFHYSLSGDLFGETIRWGLGNAVFLLKIIYTLNLEKKFKNEIMDTIRYIFKFQDRRGFFYDPLVSLLSFPNRVSLFLRTGKIPILRNETVRIAETRQTISALSLFGVKPERDFKKYPRTKTTITNYLNNLNWNLPWQAGSHFSHLLFFLKNSRLPLSFKEELIDHAINLVNSLQHQTDGFWYKGDTKLQQKINGAMKIITGLQAVDKVNFKYAHKIIDSLLLAKNDSQACDNFNIVYVLKYCNEVLNGTYRLNEIEEFFYQRLTIYKDYYFPRIGGFSFYKKKSNMAYYGGYLSIGKYEPDIHGTVLFLWGISLIAQVLKVNDKLKFKEFIT